MQNAVACVEGELAQAWVGEIWWGPWSVGFTQCCLQSLQCPRNSSDRVRNPTNNGRQLLETYTGEYLHIVYKIIETQVADNVGKELKTWKHKFSAAELDSRHSQRLPLSRYFRVGTQFLPYT